MPSPKPIPQPTPTMFARAIARTIGQISDPAFLKVLIFGLILTAITLTGAIYGAQWGIDHFYQSGSGWFSKLVDWTVGLAAFWLALMIFVPVTALFVGIFLDDVVDAVEVRYYPGRLAGPRLGLVTAGWLGVRLGVYVLFFNLLVLPLYLLTLWIPFMPMIIFYGLNSYLLGWGYYEMVAVRHLGMKEATRHRKNIRGRILLTGLIVTVMFTVPLLNLLAPILGTALLVHIFHDSYAPLEAV